MDSNTRSMEKIVRKNSYRKLGDWFYFESFEAVWASKNEEPSEENEYVRVWRESQLKNSLWGQMKLIAKYVKAQEI